MIQLRCGCSAPAWIGGPTEHGVQFIAQARMVTRRPLIPSPTTTIHTIPSPNAIPPSGSLQQLAIATDTRCRIIVRPVDRTTGRTALQDSCCACSAVYRRLNISVCVCQTCYMSLHCMIGGVRCGADYCGPISGSTAKTTDTISRLHMSSVRLSMRPVGSTDLASNVCNP